MDLLSNYPEAMHRASHLLFEDAMGPTDDLLSEGHMSNLAIQTVDGINWAIHCTVGRFCWCNSYEYRLLDLE